MFDLLFILFCITFHRLLHQLWSDFYFAYNYTFITICNMFSSNIVPRYLFHMTLFSLECSRWKRPSGWSTTSAASPGPRRTP